MDDLLKLAERCEAATGPDRRLDEAIAFAIPSDFEILGATRHYTASLDAAMTLVPEGDDHDLSFERTVRGGPDFKLWQVRYSLDTVENDPDETGPMCLGEADTLPLAICAAALRARSSVTVRGE